LEQELREVTGNTKGNTKGNGGIANRPSFD
jgi:hypothetical protein